MLVYEEYFNAGVSIYISHITIFTFATAPSQMFEKVLNMPLTQMPQMPQLL